MARGKYRSIRAKAVVPPSVAMVGSARPARVAWTHEGPPGEPGGPSVPALRFRSADVRDVLVRVALGVRDVVAERARVRRSQGELTPARIIHEQPRARLE